MCMCVYVCGWVWVWDEKRFACATAVKETATDENEVRMHTHARAHTHTHTHTPTHTHARTYLPNPHVPTCAPQVVIQGDVLYDIAEVLEKLFKINPSCVTLNEDSGKKKKKEPKLPPAQPDRY